MKYSPAANSWQAQSPLQLPVEVAELGACSIWSASKLLTFVVVLLASPAWVLCPLLRHCRRDPPAPESSVATAAAQE